MHQHAGPFDSPHNKDADFAISQAVNSYAAVTHFSRRRVDVDVQPKYLAITDFSYFPSLNQAKELLNTQLPLSLKFFLLHGKLKLPSAYLSVVHFR